MKVALKSAELKHCLHVLDAVISVTEMKKETTVAGFFYEGNQLTLRFSARGVSFSYQFQESVVSPDKIDRKQVDWKSLAGMKFPEEMVDLDFSSPGVLTFKSGALLGEIPLALDSSWVEPSTSTIPLTHSFPVGRFLTCLDFHVYGSHHNPVEAARRPVEMRSTSSMTLFFSADKQVCGRTWDEKLAQTEEIRAELLPKPISEILSSIGAKGKAKEENFDLGFTRESWRLRFKGYNVVMRNLAKKPTVDASKCFQDVSDSPGNTLTLDADYSKKILDAFSSLTSKKDDNPIVVFRQKPDGEIVARIETSKVKNVEFAIPSDVLRGSFNGESVTLNYKYFCELVDSLLDKEAKTLTLEWWALGDPKSPLNGKTLSLQSERGRYLIGRLKKR